MVEFVGSTLAHARIVAIDVAGALKIPGIAGAFTAADVPGDNRFGPVFRDEEVLAAGECHHIGQPIVALAGESREALRAARGGGPDRAGAPARRADHRRSDRRPPLHRPDATDRPGRRRGRPGVCRARPRRDIPHRRPGAFLPRDPGRAGDPRRIRADHGPFLDPEPQRGAGGRRPWPRPAAESGRLRLQPDGRRVRGQGVAGGTSRDAGGDGRHPHGPAGADRLPAGRGHAGHGQAASVPVPLQGRLRRRGADRRPRASSCTRMPAARPTCRWP